MYAVFGLAPLAGINQCHAQPAKTPVQLYQEYPGPDTSLQYKFHP